MSSLWPSDDQWQAFQNTAGSSNKIAMLNLLSYRATADYSTHPDETACSGEEAYRRYAKQALPCIESYGGRVIFSGKSLATVIGPVDENWDEVILVEYPSIQTMGEMIESERYQSFAHHRTAALEDSRLIPIPTE